MNRLILTLLGLSVVNLVSTSEAQQVRVLSVEGLPSGQTDGKIKDSIRSSIAVAGPGVISFGGVDPDNASSLFGALSNEAVRRELMLTDEQFESASRIMQESSRRLSELVKSSMAEGKASKIAGIRELAEELRQEAEGVIEEILRPEQLKRLKQLAYQIEIAREGLAESIVNGRLGQAIGIVEGQRSHLSERAIAIEAKVQAEIARLQQAAREELFKELNAEQRQKAQDLIGTYFDYKEPSAIQSIKQSLRKSAKPERREGRSADKQDK